MAATTQGYGIGSTEALGNYVVVMMGSLVALKAFSQGYPRKTLSTSDGNTMKNPEAPREMNESTLRKVN